MLLAALVPCRDNERSGLTPGERTHSVGWQKSLANLQARASPEIYGRGRGLVRGGCLPSRPA